MDGQVKREKRIAVFISGNGSNLQALIDSQSQMNIKIHLVVSNSIKAYGLSRAKSAQIPTLVSTLKSFKDVGKTRIDYDLDLVSKVLEFFESNPPDLIVLAGFMHILSSEFIETIKVPIINLHPALPGAFDGINAIERAYEAFQKGVITSTGVMVHRVIPQVDRGQVITSQVVPIQGTDTLQDLKERIHLVEHELIVKATVLILSDVNYSS